MTYHLENKISAWLSDIVVVGCGGTGGFVAEGLCRLLVGQPNIRVVLIDHDRVEERNLVRQSFYREDLGRFKAQALAERLARNYRRPVAYSLNPLALRRSYYYPEHPWSQAALVIGCVDNPLAREAIASHMQRDRWWVDAGNGRDFGQVLVGNARGPELHGAFDAGAGVCRALPLPTQVRPELLVPEAPRPACAEAVEAGEQSPTINQAMATLILEVVRRLLAGTCTWWQVYLDLGAGSLRTVEATPEGVSKVMGIRQNRLLQQRERR